MFTDLRQALRTLTKAPGFSAAVILILALGIGANTAIFSIVDGVLLKPLPFADASRIVAIQSITPRETDGSCSFPDFSDWKSQSTSIDRMAGYANGSVIMTGSGEATNVPAAFVTPDVFPLLGAAPIAGRLFRAEDDQRGAAPVALISETLWRRRFSSDPAIVGRSVTLEGQSFTIVGVLPASFRFPIRADRIEAWVPLGSIPLTAEWREVRGAQFMHAIGRLRAGASLEQAQAELTTIAGRLSAAYPTSNSDRTARVEPLQRLLVRDYRLALLVLLAAVGTVLLIACGNVANLLLTRGMARRRELAIRAALGAGRGRLVRQLLTESVALSILAGAASLLFAMWAVPALGAASPVDIPRLDTVRIDRGVLLFTTLVSLATGVFFGLFPAVQLSRSDGGETLKDAGRGSIAVHTSRTRQLLVVAEVALSLVLLASAGLLIRSLVRLQHVDPGFAADRAIAMELSLPGNRYADGAARVAFYRRLRDALGAIPAAGATAVATTLPLSGNDMGIGFAVEGHPPSDPKSRPSAAFFSISPEYFTAMGVPILRGRAFTARDDERSPLVAIVSDTMARRYWPGEDPIGKRLTIHADKQGPRTVVGIVGDVKQSELSEANKPAMYTPYPQSPWPFMMTVVRTQADPAAVGGALRAAVTRVDPDQPVGEITPLNDYLARAIAAPRFTAALVGSFAGLAVVLAGIGLYGVIAFGVAERRREIGIRLALGAQSADVRALVVSQAVRLGAVGIGIGLAGALGAAQAIRDLLFSVGPTDPATLAGVCVLLAGILVAATYVPVRRATQVDPVVALRMD